MRHNRWLVLAAAGAMVSLAGCGDSIREQLGLTKQSPDEFQVVAQAPLSLPPDFNLRPPEPGAPRPQEGTTRDQAAAAVFSGGLTAGGGYSTAGASHTSGSAPQSSGELALLQAAGANDVDPAIRAQIDAETAAQIERDKSVVDRLVFWRTPEPYGAVVDPVAESQRLEDNAAAGKPVTEGETPMIKRRKRAVLEGIF
ncbi:MAG: DUF3035 domain-containing protein [Dongiaceae bacterium]